MMYLIGGAIMGLFSLAIVANTIKDHEACKPQEESEGKV